MRRVASCQLPVASEEPARAIRLYLFATGNWQLATLLVMLLIAGCVPNKTGGPQPYFGPTESLPQLAADVNANDQQISSLWSRIGYFEADVREERGGKSRFVNGSGGYLLMLRDSAGNGSAVFTPGAQRTTGNSSEQMRLRASKAGISTVLDVGANAEYIWLVSPVADKAWWAHRKNIGNPCMQQMPIDSLAVMQVLGIGGIEANLLAEPAPVMKFNNDRDVYMVTWQSRASGSQGRWVARREIWYDRRSKLPVLVNLFDDNGRIVVSAYLSQHRAIENTTAKIATHFQLFFPDTDSHFTFSLSDVKLSSGDYPNQRSFLFNPAHTGAGDVQQMDEACK